MHEDEDAGERLSMRRLQPEQTIAAPSLEDHLSGGDQAVRSGRGDPDHQVVGAVVVEVAPLERRTDPFLTDRAARQAGTSLAGTDVTKRVVTRAWREVREAAEPS
jgi:hypothetical protein